VCSVRGDAEIPRTLELDGSLAHEMLKVRRLTAPQALVYPRRAYEASLVWCLARQPYQRWPYSPPLRLGALTSLFGPPRGRFTVRVASDPVLACLCLCIN
jgi:hypothetical protein